MTVKHFTRLDNHRSGVAAIVRVSNEGVLAINSPIRPPRAPFARRDFPRCRSLIPAPVQAVGLLALGLLLGAQAPVRADIKIVSGNDPQQGKENVFFSSDQAAPTVSGTTKSGITVDFTSAASPQQTLVTSSNGQASVAAQESKKKAVDVKSITTSVPGYTFTSLVENPENAAKNSTITVDVTGLTDTGATTHASQSFDDAGNGNNYFTVIADNGFKIESVTVTDSSGFEDLKQPRITVFSPTTASPEPASLTLLCLGTTCLGGLSWWRKRRPALAD